MDSGRLTRGRTYARRGAVEPITVTPGLAKAKIHGSAPRPYSSTVAVKQLSDTDWNRFLHTVAARAAHIAALLDRDMPPDLVDDARAAGVQLLPGVGDLSPSCSCPDSGWPCKHASALCYQIARLLDLDPFVLFLLRGRGEHELMDELRARNAAAASAEVATATGGDLHSTEAADFSRAGTTGRERAADVFAAAPDTADVLATLISMESGVLPDFPGRPPILAASREPTGIDQTGLELVAIDTAQRSHGLLATYSATDEPARTPILPRLSPWQDAVRMLAARLDDESLRARIAEAYDTSDTDLSIAALAWHQGGPTGLDTLEKPWSPTATQKSRTHKALEDYAEDGTPTRLRLWRNRWTADAKGVQIRLGTDNRWYPYRRDPENNRWWPEGPAETDPAAALAALLAAEYGP
ncbi:SWIM zinc finger family protein [Catenulispora rubra]|uniref:SWIM zinc finger family protein n=1 Tax=Catenulispora rubra TaxID=280293 RepID=UPI001E2C89B1|nr:SWIM zinc finger family protein [Catenulispora rubra]